MSTLIKIGIKDKNGQWKNYMVSVSDEIDQYGNNVSMYVEQSKEDREAKKKRTYVGNGRVVWTDGKIETAPNPNAPKMEQDIPSEPPAPASTPESTPEREENQPTPEDYEAGVSNEYADEEKDDLPF